MASLAELRAKIKAQEDKTQRASTPSDNAIYPHWNIPESTTATVRFLPDADPKNEFFWVERQIIKLPFNGVKGDSNVKQITVQVPCVEMYGDNCPILAEVRPWYKDESLKETANKYWKKRSYIFEGFVRVNPMAEDKSPVNPIRRFIIGPQLIPLIKAGIMDPEIQELPTDYVHGLDFHFKKTIKPGGTYADYSTSTWSRRESALTEAEQAAIEAHGLFNLTDFLPKKPSEAELRIIKEMFEASVEGQPYDNDKWGAYYRPFGLDLPVQTNGDASATPETAVVHAESEEPVVTSSVKIPKKDTTSSDKAQDILAMIRNRQTSKKTA